MGGWLDGNVSDGTGRWEDDRMDGKVIDMVDGICRREGDRIDEIVSS